MALANFGMYAAIFFFFFTFEYVFVACFYCLQRCLSWLYIHTFSSDIPVLIFYSTPRNFFLVWGLILERNPNWKRNSLLRVHRAQSTTDTLCLTAGLLISPSIGLGKTLYSFRCSVSLHSLHFPVNTCLVFWDYLNLRSIRHPIISFCFLLHRCQ